MDIKQALQVLEVEDSLAVSLDESFIKAKYRKLLLLHNPEDDPEGFRILREAYEEALKAIRNGDETKKEENTAKDEIDLWVDQFDEIYRYMEFRCNPDIWKEKLEDPVCIDLDTADEARNRLLVFLAAHPHLPREVWIVIDKKLHIGEERDALIEKFPIEFIRFVIAQTKIERFGNYHWFYFQGEESEAEYDRYIEEYYLVNHSIHALEGQIENESLGDTDAENVVGDVIFTPVKEILKKETFVKVLERLENKLDALEKHQIYHPYQEIERLRLALIKEEYRISSKGREERTEAVARRLLEKYPDPYIMRVCGEVLASCDNWEEAKQLWEKVLEIIPNQMDTICDIARYYLEKGDSDTAYETIRERLSYLDYDIKVKNLYMKIQQERIGRYKERNDNPVENMPAYIEYCRALFGCNRFSESLEALDRYTFTEEMPEFYDYAEMKGRSLLKMKRYDEAFHFLSAWEKALAELPEDETEKNARRKKGLGFQCFTIAECLYFWALSMDVSLLEKAEEYLKKGISVEENSVRCLVYEDLLERVYIKKGQYKECVDLADQQLKKDEQFLPAYIRRQEAYYLMHNAQGVIEDYYRIISLHTDYYRPYVLALRIYLYFDRLEDAESILQEAKKSGVDHPALRIEEIEYLRKLPKTDGNREKIVICIEKLMEIVQEQNPEPETPAEDVITEERVRFELAAMYCDYEMDGPALQLLNDMVRNGCRDYEVYQLKGRLHHKLQQYYEALKCYNDLVECGLRDPELFYDLGKCHLDAGNEDLALEAFQKVLEINPKDERVFCSMARLYRERYERFQIVEDYERSLEFYNRLIGIEPIATYYAERAILQRYRGMLDAAIIDFQNALTHNELNDYSENYLIFYLGETYFIKRDIEKAEEELQKIVEDEELGKNALFLLADICGARKDWLSGSKLLQEHVLLFLKDKEYQFKLGEFLIAAGKEKEADRIYRSLLDKGIINRTEYYYKSLYLQATAHPETIIDQLNKIDRLLYNSIMPNERFDPVAEPTKARYYSYLYAEYGNYIGEILLYCRRLMDAKRSLENAKQHRKDTRNYRCLAICCKLLGEDKVRLSDKPFLALFGRKYYPEEYYKVGIDYAAKGIRLLLDEISKPDKKTGDGGDLNTEEYYLHSCEAENAIRYQYLAEMHQVLGDIQTGIQYTEEMRNCAVCPTCSFQECWEYYLAKGYGAEFSGNLEEAARNFEKAREINPMNMECVLNAYFSAHPEKRGRKK